MMPSVANTPAAVFDVRFTPESRHVQCTSPCSLCAKANSCTATNRKTTSRRSLRSLSLLVTQPRLLPVNRSAQRDQRIQIRRRVVTDQIDRPCAEDGIFGNYTDLALKGAWCAKLPIGAAEFSGCDRGRPGLDDRFPARNRPGWRPPDPRRGWGADHFHHRLLARTCAVECSKADFSRRSVSLIARR